MASLYQQHQLRMRNARSCNIPSVFSFRFFFCCFGNFFFFPSHPLLMFVSVTSDSKPHPPAPVLRVRAVTSVNGRRISTRERTRGAYVGTVQGSCRAENVERVGGDVAKDCRDDSICVHNIIRECCIVINIAHVSAWKLDEENRTDPMLLSIFSALLTTTASLFGCVEVHWFFLS